VLRRRGRPSNTALAVIGGAVALVVGAAVTVVTVDASAQDIASGSTIKAASFSAQSGARTEPTGDTGGGQNVGWLSSGDWMRYDGVDLGAAGSVTTTMRIAAAYADRPGTVEVRLDSLTGQVVATIPSSATGGWQSWVTKTDTEPSPGGKHDVYLLMRSQQPNDFVNVNWFAFQGAAGGTPSASGAAPSATPTTGSPTTATPTTGTPTATSSAVTAPVAGWVDVNAAAWQQELTAFNAIPYQPIPAGTTRVSEFHTDCSVSNVAPDDPIVFPNLPGASHMHTFFGATVNASSKTSDLATQPTNCNAPGDSAAYWVPTLYHDGVPVKMKSFRAYYGARVTDPTKVVPFPPGLVMVVGNAKLQVPTPANYTGQFWCAGSAETGRSADGNWPVCAPGGNLIFQLSFQDCWDGKHIDSPDHKSHMGPMTNGACTGAYPVAVPNLSLMVNYDSLGGDGLSLSSGMASSMHGDFMNGWAADKLSALVKVCIDAHAKCGTTPSFVGG
jgi:Domain of unknown function (DUF1996)/Carbohydrate binding module (family 6)